MWFSQKKDTNALEIICHNGGTAAYSQNAVVVAVDSCNLRILRESLLKRVSLSSSLV